MDIDFIDMIDDEVEICYVLIQDTDIILNECYIDEVDDFIFYPMAALDLSGRVNDMSQFDLKTKLFIYQDLSSIDGFEI